MVASLKQRKMEILALPICALLLDDVKALAKDISDKGYSLEIPPCIGCDHNLQAWIRDPNGLRIELMQVSPESPHADFM